MKTPRVRADAVRVGDRILSGYAPRTWQVVEAITVDPFAAEGQQSIMLDTPTNRTWWHPDDFVACRRSGDLSAPQTEQP